MRATTFVYLLFILGGGSGNKELGVFPLFPPLRYTAYIDSTRGPLLAGGPMEDTCLFHLGLFTASVFWVRVLHSLAMSASCSMTRFLFI